MIQMNKPVDILMTAPLPARSCTGFQDHFVVHQLWDAHDQNALLAEIGSRIRGIAAGGHVQISRELLQFLPALELIANFGVGYDRIDTAAATEKGITVTNTPDVLTEEVADLTLGLLLATVRRLPQADRYLRNGQWLESPFPLSPSLRGRKVGILGLGRIGKVISRRCVAFGVEVVYHGRSEQRDVGLRFIPSLIDMAHEVDVLIVVVPGGADSRNLVNADVLEALGLNGILINVARGTVVDEAALIDALQNRKILAAGLDVFAHEPRVPDDLIALENTVLLPHIGSASTHTREEMGQLVLDNLVSWFGGNGPITPVPEMRSSADRAC
jgi:lactate dehydrogenase-like 2-hydroxyacid dehydrogenase